MSRRQKIPTQSNLRGIVDSTAAIAFTRVIMPVLIAIIGWLLTSSVADMKQAIANVTTATYAQGADIAVLKDNVADLKRAVRENGK